MQISRRMFVDRAIKSSVLTLSFAVGGAELLLTPQEARAQALPLRKLSGAEAHTLELLGEAIVPGSTAAGLVHFIDHQLANEPNDSLLIAKYFQVAPPYLNFYTAGVTAAQSMARRDNGAPLESRDKQAVKQLLTEMSKPGTVTDGYPIFLFYMCLRSDAVDVVYGTPAGFKSLNVPYMQHILPPEGWDA